uniref:TSA: Wollemia nobilis Ref_Wollemi_Transcript_1710_1097 transcribed RNA sequence n=1 Tax=Wollemia nobilis TaxID=56998 RepID=A0A0C9RQM2_9CONI
MARAPILSAFFSSSHSCSASAAPNMNLGCREFIRKLPSSSTLCQKKGPLPVPRAFIVPALSPSLSVKRSSSPTVKPMKCGTGRGLYTGRVAFSAANGAPIKEESPSKMENREILVQHILVSEDQLKLLIELQMRVARGEDLSVLATEHSICPSKKEGGMLGWVQKGQMVPEFEEAAFTAPLNKPVRCKTKFGWHLLQVLSERDGGFLKDIEPEELLLKMQDDNFVNETQLMDVREPDEVSIASIPGFKIYPLRQFGSWGPAIATELDPSKETYVLCHHGMRSLQVARWLQSQGFKQVYNVSGGIHRYSQKVDSSIPMY